MRWCFSSLFSSVYVLVLCVCFLTSLVLTKGIQECADRRTAKICLSFINPKTFKRMWYPILAGALSVCMCVCVIIKWRNRNVVSEVATQGGPKQARIHCFMSRSTARREKSTFISISWTINNILLLTVVKVCTMILPKGCLAKQGAMQVASNPPPPPPNSHLLYVDA